jgi:hypothetical protein
VPGVSASASCKDLQGLANEKRHFRRSSHALRLEITSAVIDMEGDETGPPGWQNVCSMFEACAQIGVSVSLAKQHAVSPFTADFQV